MQRNSHAAIFSTSFCLLQHLGLNACSSCLKMIVFCVCGNLSRGFKWGFQGQFSALSVIDSLQRARLPHSFCCCQQAGSQYQSKMQQSSFFYPLCTHLSLKLFPEYVQLPHYLGANYIWDSGMDKHRRNPDNVSSQSRRTFPRKEKLTAWFFGFEIHYTYQGLGGEKIIVPLLLHLLFLWFLHT